MICSQRSPSTSHRATCPLGTSDVPSVSILLRSIFNSSQLPVAMRPHAASSDDVDGMYAKLLRWLLGGSVAEQTISVLHALKAAHPSAVSLALRHLKQTVSDLNAEQHKRSGIIDTDVYCGGGGGAYYRSGGGGRGRGSSSSGAAAVVVVVFVGAVVVAAAPLAAGAIPTNSKLPNNLLSFAISLSPWRTLIETAG